MILRAIANSADKNENLLNDNDLRFSIQLFSCWDFKIANRETADNKIASIATGKLIDPHAVGFEILTDATLIIQIV